MGCELERDKPSKSATKTATYAPLMRQESDDLQAVAPLRQQYLRIEKQFPDTIVLFRLGDFYGSFNDDAKKVAEARNIVLAWSQGEI